LKNYVYFLAIILFQNNPKPWLMCLEDTIQGSVVDSFEIIQFKQVYPFQNSKQKFRKQKKKKTEQKKRKGEGSSQLGRTRGPNRATTQQPPEISPASLTSLSLSLPGGTHLSAASSPPISLLLSLVS
jgi:hypothetical protein